jgi:hypothetical protein
MAKRPEVSTKGVLMKVQMRHDPGMGQLIENTEGI